MPMRYRIDPEENLITLTATNTIRYDDVVSAFVERTKEPTYQPGMNLLWDGREAALDFSTADVIKLVRFFSARQALRGAGFRVALVAGSSFTFGMARMYEGHAAELPEQIRVFRDFDDARRWVAAWKEA